jgi:dTDP-4-amino-4,6-dideoxygalactose transaminase
MREDFLPAADPRANFEAHREEIMRAICDVLDSGQYILGPHVAAFETAFARYLGVNHVVGVASGTDALHLALRACGIGADDEVVTVSLTAVATVAAIELAGATVGLVDIDPATFTINPRQLEAAITPRTKAVVPVHLYGRPAAMPAILEIVRRHNLRVVEDCAQSHGHATSRDGHAAAYSFYPTKNLGALGDAGAVATNDDAVADRIRLLREYGWRERHVSQIPGANSRLDELQAAVLLAKLRFLDVENERRRQIARIYDSVLAGTGLTLPQPTTDHVYHQYVIRCDRRDDLRAFLKSQGVGTLIHYPHPIHLQPAYKDRVTIGPGGLAHTEEACGEILSLPMYPELTDQQVARVAEMIAGWRKK